VDTRVGERKDRARVSEDDAGKLQVKYNNFSGNKSVNTLVATNHLTAIERAFEALRARVGDIDEFVRNELKYTPEEFKKSFSAEQVEALALAIDNIKRGAGFIIGDQTGIGKGRVVAAMIRYAKLNGKTPVFVTQMPDLYGDMMRDLNDIGMSNIKPLMTNNNASVPLDAEALAWFGEKQGIQTQIAELQDDKIGRASCRERV
jgi:chromosomal replication initiation ATPase DnaA